MAKKKSLTENSESSSEEDFEVLTMPDEDIFPEINQSFELKEILDPNLVKKLQSGSN